MIFHERGEPIAKCYKIPKNIYLEFEAYFHLFIFNTLTKLTEAYLWYKYNCSNKIGVYKFY